MKLVKIGEAIGRARDELSRSKPLKAKRRLREAAVEDEDEDVENNEAVFAVNANSAGGGVWGERDEEAQFYKDKFDALQCTKGRLRQLERELEGCEQREAVAAKVVQRLESKIRKLEQADADDSLGQSNEKIEEQRRLLAFYESVTSMAVRVDEGEYTCTVKNRLKRQAVRFAIIEDNKDQRQDDDASITFVPKANANLLPEYLQQSIQLDKSYAPHLTTDVLSSLFSEEGDGEAEEEEE